MHTETEVRGQKSEVRITTQALQIFCAAAEEHRDNRQYWKKPHLLWHYRGDLTERGETQIRSAIGYEQLHWDTIALDGCIMVCAFGLKEIPDEEEVTFNQPFPSSIYRSLFDLDESVPPTPVPSPSGHATLVLGRLVSRGNLIKIRTLPNVEFVGQTDRDTDRPIYFRFTGGAGAVMPLEFAPEIHNS